MRMFSIMAIVLLFSFTFAIFASADEYVYEAKNKSGNYSYSESDSESDGISLLWIAGPVIGALAVIGICVSYKRGIHGEQYPLSEYSKLNLKASSDNFTYKTVIVTRIPDPATNKK